jgi:hypothetical protein
VDDPRNRLTNISMAYAGRIYAERKEWEREKEAHAAMLEQPLADEYLLKLKEAVTTEKPDDYCSVCAFRFPWGQCYPRTTEAGLTYMLCVACETDRRKSIRQDKPEAEYLDETVQAPSENVLEEANRLIYGDRRKDYGDCTASFQRIADMWALVLGSEVSADQVALCLIQLKVARACNDADKGAVIKRDSIVDIAGYAGCLGQMQ